MHSSTGVHMDADMVAALIALLTYYEAEFVLMQARLAGVDVPVEPTGNVVPFQRLGGDGQ